VYLEAGHRLHLAYFDLVPRNVVDPTGVLVSEVVMPLHIRVEQHAVPREVQFPQQTFFEIESVNSDTKMRMKAGMRIYE
jgi:hypothetical protein